MPVPTFEPTRCAICNVYDDATEVYGANFTAAAFNEEIFSARRLPDRIHYRIVRCNRCGLLRSDPVADTATITALYQRSVMAYGREVDSLRKTYGEYLDRLNAHQDHKGHLLEIGAANGFFLEEALERGYAQVTGIEPGAPMIEQAAPSVREHIVADVMRPGLFEQGVFDVVCLFQVFDHLPDPAAVLRESHNILRDDGLILLFNHNEQALSARLLGERSPIIDIEHTYLYNFKTMRRILEDNGFEVLELGPSRNLYRLEYLVRLLPLPNPVRAALAKLLTWTSLGKINLHVSLGNLYAIAAKRKASAS